MGVFEDVIMNARTAAETVGKEAGRLVDLSRLRLDAAEIQRDISKKYESLGRIVYDACKSGSPADAGCGEYIVGIDDLYRKLDEVNEKIRVLRRKTDCPKCGFSNDEKATFCSRCGTKLSDEAEGAAPEAPQSPESSAE